jgi:hypothetical protein
LDEISALTLSFVVDFYYIKLKRIRIRKRGRVGRQQRPETRKRKNSKLFSHLFLKEQSFYFKVF